MGIVSEHIVGLVRKQVKERSTVVWYDPHGAYRELAATLTPESVSDAAVHRYDPQRGFVALRHDVEPLWTGSAPPRLVIYVPLAQAAAHHALIEYEVGGVVIQPGQQPPERNTGLAAVARAALQSVFPPAKVEEIVGQVEAGQLSLAELDALAEVGGGGVVALIFGTGNAADVGLRFLDDPSLDAQVNARQAVGQLAGTLGDLLGVAFATNKGTAGLRAQLARLVLVTDLAECLGESVPASLKTIPVAASPVARQAAVGLTRAWRNRRDAAASYVHWADKVQAEIGLGSLKPPLEALARSETFRAGEVRLQQEVESALAHRASEQTVHLSEQRVTGFWAAQVPEIKARWQVIVAAGRVLVESARLDAGLKGKGLPAGELVSKYALGDSPWCALDTAQRHLERDFHRLEVDLQQHSSLVQLVTRARQQYARAADRLAEAFTHAYADGKFTVPNVTQQTEVYRQVVGPAAKHGRTAYILVDALRYEMARELCGILDPSWSFELTPALAAPPTVTEIGMAALLPGAERGLGVAQAKGGGLAAVVEGKALKTRQERLAHFVQAAGGKIPEARLDQLAPLSNAHLRDALNSASLSVVTSTDIDALCENTPDTARRHLDDTLDQLRRAVKTLFGLGVQTVVICADHGYLFGEKLASGEAIDPPGGKTVTLKRRVWVGQGGAQSEGLLRTPLSAFGIGGDLELVTPWNLSCLKVQGGAMEYFHGGLSLQEVLVPVLVVRAGPLQAAVAGAHMEWKLTLGSQKISTRFLSVTVEGHTGELLQITPPTVRVEVRAGDQPISTPVSAGYGFDEATKDVQLAVASDQPQAIAKNTIMLRITEAPSAGEATVHLLDAATGVSLARLDGVPIAITFD